MYTSTQHIDFCKQNLGNQYYAKVKETIFSCSYLRIYFRSTFCKCLENEKSMYTIFIMYKYMCIGI